jgi:hypothetical protein
MAIAKRTSRRSTFRRGKRPAKRDRRNLKFARLLFAPAKLPETYDFDKKHKGVPTPMFGNDRLGDCVIAGRAHQTLRFERSEQKKNIRITNKDVVKEYRKETGGPDTGLEVLGSLKLWRKRGWQVGKTTYTIQAFSEVDRTNHRSVKQAIFLDIGVGVGLMLPESAMDQLDAGKPWDVVAGPTGKAGPDDGHYVLVTGYTKKGLICVTWGAKQEMTWAFFDKYCDEAYAIIDAVNTPKKKKALNLVRLTAFLEQHPKDDGSSPA